MKVHETTNPTTCPTCHASKEYLYNFKNSDAFLKKEVSRIIQERKDLDLDGLVQGLDSIIINTEPHLQVSAATDLIHSTGLSFSEAFEDDQFKTIVLTHPDSASFLIRSRKQRQHENNPFFEFNTHPKSQHVPNTRLETFVFTTPNIKKYVQIQKKRGVNFLTDDIIQGKNYSFIQTIPSQYTGNSIGLIQWDKENKSYQSSNAEKLHIPLEKPKKSYLQNIKQLDHTATRVRAADRDAAIIEFMELTNYYFDFAIYVKLFNSITNVARLSSKDFAMVFTSGVIPYKNNEESGPTEKFIHNYGTRVHHMAFHTENIEETISQLKQNQMKFLIGLVGSEKDGLKQTFSNPSRSTLLVNEYIHRYGDFDGFFTKNNVTRLTEATDKQ
ncbi:MAG TPA: hypothetical protein VKP59_01775 [Candidatus Thermoplasmatota archaeon]|nr:hypothetical protein [Candidatus Thermoplasmatota archaeon]